MNMVDDMTRIAISRAIKEGVFDYSASWRTYSDIIGAFIGCLVRAKVKRGDMVSLFRNIFNLVWRKGLEQAIYNIDEKFCIPLPEKCMSFLLGSLDLETALRCPTLIIRENLAFFHE